jgi:epoxyqueuosine reductase
MTTLTQSIDAEARKAGFATVGFVEAGPAQGAPHYARWLADGHAADMAYLHRHAELKQTPANVAPGVRSIIAVAARYPTNTNPGRGFSTYARGLDYHDVIRRKLRELAAFIRARQPLQVSRICVDSAPLPEREWAIRAGLGWQGRQGQLVNPTAGCCLALGFLLVDIDLEPSPRIEDQCGTCRDCISACPTGAALGDSRVDARRCISYLTIEHKGEIPADLEPAMRGSLFGCDCCTAVCPWNGRATAPVMPELESMGSLPSAEGCLAMSEAAFEARFKGTAVYRTGLERLKRNAALAG